ncbi:NGFI-A-binding protein homolog isoform X3 [Rhodnius prolixus]|uniref:NGFI-A-binding protein homolog isoform X3 n=1 Tax=Rhodnius prolixus TaxID=13249 RepID=UPI003D18D83D
MDCTVPGNLPATICPVISTTVQSSPSASSISAISSTTSPTTSPFISTTIHNNVNHHHHAATTGNGIITTTVPSVNNNHTINNNSPSTNTSSSTNPSLHAVAATQPASTNNSSVSLNHQPVKIISRNANGTIVWTSSPTNEAELQLYRVMQRASLLAYYDTLLEMGGDDVQQLCEAGEEEFLEIMALVGMASKPLHVRRLQKALQEWLTNPSMFRSPLLTSGTGGAFSPRPPLAATPLVLSPQPPGLAVPPPPPPPPKDTPPSLVHPNQSTSPALVDSGCPSGSPSGSGGPSPGPPGSPLQLPPVLLEAQVAKLAEAAQLLVNTLPQMEPKSHTAKKKMNKDLEQVLAMSEDDPRRMELIRKFAAIYGRFDCKRKPEKPLTLHEVSVNEAAAQICRFMPALLTRRDELFPLARQVVRDSGYHYSKGHSKSYARGSTFNGDQPLTKRCRYDQILSPDSEEVVRRRQERLEQIADELKCVNEKTEVLLDGKKDSGETIKSQVEALQSRQQQLLFEQTQLVNQSLQHNRFYRRNSTGRLTYHDPERPDTDDTDSQLSYSNDSSPLPDIGDSRDSTSRDYDPSEHSPGKHNQNDGDYEHDIATDLKFKKHTDECYDESFYQENKIQVIASSGGNIIAVANPALSMSPAMALDNSRASIILKKDALSASDI